MGATTAPRREEGAGVMVESDIAKSAARRDVPTNHTREESVLGTGRHSFRQHVRSAVTKDAHVKSRGEECVQFMVGLLATMTDATTRL